MTNKFETGELSRIEITEKDVSFEELNRRTALKILEVLSQRERPVSVHQYLGIASRMALHYSSAFDQFFALGYDFRPDCSIVFLDEIPLQQWAD